jgi:hypothetical protein
MAETELRIRSAMAAEIAHRLAEKRHTGVTKIVEEALLDLEAKLITEGIDDPLERIRALADADLAQLPPGTTSAHDDLYDENGLPIW